MKSQARVEKSNREWMTTIIVFCYFVATVIGIIAAWHTCTGHVVIGFKGFAIALPIGFLGEIIRRRNIYN